MPNDLINSPLVSDYQLAWIIHPVYYQVELSRARETKRRLRGNILRGWYVSGEIPGIGYIKKEKPRAVSRVAIIIFKAMGLRNRFAPSDAEYRDLSRGIFIPPFRGGKSRLSREKTAESALLPRAIPSSPLFSSHTAATRR